MGRREAANQFIASIIAPLLGQRAWGATLGVGSFITAEFGEVAPTTKAHRREHGDPRPKLRASVESLNGLALMSIEVLSAALDTAFTFEGDLVLRLFPIYSEEHEHWKLFTPDGNVLILGPDATWSYQSADRP
jgi:hypothetical protein